MLNNESVTKANAEIPVTRTFLPPIEEYLLYAKRAWEKAWITNRGELVQELEEKLRDYLGVNNIIVTNNGTVPLQIAIKALGLQGEIITTPFSYIASTSVIVWENCTPVFADIHPEYLTIDEEKIEQLITSKTSAILATHVFGNPCNVDVIETISKKYSLKVIYDAAHCFGVKYKEVSIFNYGDISTCSFHATKLFHTAEGGAMFCNDSDLNHKLYYHHNFGHNGPLDFFGLGINGKISELQAAMGLAVLPYMGNIIKRRQQIANKYLEGINRNDVQFLKIRGNTEWNYSYFPVIFSSENTLLKALVALTEANVFPRRYFYPSLNTVNYIGGRTMPVSESISSRVFCLPIFFGLSDKEVEKIIQLINAID